MIKKYIERTKGNILDMSCLKSIMKTVYSSKQKISKEEKILMEIETPPLHTIKKSCSILLCRPQKTIESIPTKNGNGIKLKD